MRNINAASPGGGLVRLKSYLSVILLLFIQKARKRFLVHYENYVRYCIVLY